VRHDCDREIAAAVREATERCERWRETAKRGWVALSERNATIMELRAQLKFSDEQAEKIETLLDPHIDWDGQPSIETKLRAEIMELRAEVERLNKLVRSLSDELNEDAERLALVSHQYRQAAEAHKVEVERLNEMCEHLSGEAMAFEQERDIARVSLAEMTRCRTAADVQHARERQQGTTYPWHAVDAKERLRTVYAGPATVTLRPTYQRTDEDGPMWRPDAPFSKGDLAT
jgi:myosin heavy subunit